MTRSLFTLGADRWPGLTKLLEEQGEVLQVIGKLMATGGGVEHWGGERLDRRLEEELGDAWAALQFVVALTEVEAGRVEARRDAKLSQFLRWRAEEQGQSTQEAALSLGPPRPGQVDLLDESVSDPRYVDACRVLATVMRERLAYADMTVQRSERADTEDSRALAELVARLVARGENPNTWVRARLPVAHGGDS